MKQEVKNKIENILSTNTNEKEIIFQLKKLLYDIDLKNAADKESKSVTNLVSESINHLYETSPTNIIKTGFYDFDSSYGGFDLGEFIVIGGRPAMGKTQFLVNLALNISIEKPVLYFTFDQSDYFLTNRFISSLSHIPMTHLLHCNINTEQKEKLAQIKEEISKHKIFINDSFNDSISAFKVHCQKMINEEGVKVIFVDSLQMIKSNKYHNNREDEINHISRELKNIAKDLNVCVIVTSQLSKVVEERGGDKRPILSDLRECGAIEQDADKVILMYRPEYYGFEYDTEGNSTIELVEFIFVKNRNGKLGTFKLLRDTEFTNFRNFDGYKGKFPFSASRLDEMLAENPLLNTLIDKFDLDEDFPPF